VLARRIEDEWDLYENRVAVRLVDNLLSYLAQRLEELRKIEETLQTHRDHSDEARTSFWRARRVMTLWADTLSTKTEDDLRATMRRLERAQRELQALMDAPLYQRISRRLTVPLSLKSTNILVNDTHYRKVAALWRAWARFGHKRQETSRQRAERRQREGAAWDQFVLHLVARAFDSLGWCAEGAHPRWQLRRQGWSTVEIKVDEGVVTIRASEITIRLLPLCARLSGADGASVLSVLHGWDKLDGQVAAVHVGAAADLREPDRASGWSIAGRAVLFGCSPWGIDSEERMARLLNGWLNQQAVACYPFSQKIRPPSGIPSEWTWVRPQAKHLIAFRAPNSVETQAARSWVSKKLTQWQNQRREVREAKKPERDALNALAGFVDASAAALQQLPRCPVCGGKGMMQAHPGKRANGTDATWWAICECGSEWGLRPCTGCGSRFRALLPHVGVDLQRAAAGAVPADWPDKVLGRDVWAQPCNSGSSPGQFRCPECGACPGGGCARCEPPSNG
jgi:hypothetical protein